MHIALMARGGMQWLGGSQYIKNLARALTSLPSDERGELQVSVIVTSGFDIGHFADIQDVVKVMDCESLMAPMTFSNRIRWRLRRATGGTLNPRMEDFLNDQRVDFVYPARVRRNWTSKMRFAEWIPDFQYDYFPDGSNPLEIAERKSDNLFVTSSMPRIVLSSKTAESDCIRLFPAATGKTFVFRFRISPPNLGDPARVDCFCKEFHIPERFFLVSNMFAPTKNHSVIFDALGKLATEGCRPIVVLTGNIHDYRNPDFASTIFHGIHRNGVNDQIRLLGVVDKADQVNLMRRAVAIIQPSLFEGWSTIVEEARCLERPLIVSDLPIHREQDMPGAMYFDPNSSHELANILRSTWKDLPSGPDLASEQRGRMKYEQLVIDSARIFLRLARGEIK